MSSRNYGLPKKQVGFMVPEVTANGMQVFKYNKDGTRNVWTHIVAEALRSEILDKLDGLTEEEKAHPDVAMIINSPEYGPSYEEQTAEIEELRSKLTALKSN